MVFLVTRYSLLLSLILTFVRIFETFISRPRLESEMDNSISNHLTPCAAPFITLGSLNTSPIYTSSHVFLLYEWYRNNIQIVAAETSSNVFENSGLFIYKQVSTTLNFNEWTHIFTYARINIFTHKYTHEAWRGRECYKPALGSFAFRLHFSFNIRWNGTRHI